jgi:hypothetical protein
MKIPKYFCSTCGKPSSRKWNLYRHIGNCHDGLGNCVSNWDFPVDTYRPHWNRWENGAMNQKENSHYIRPDLMKRFLSSNESNDRKPFGYQHTLTEAFLKELAEKMAASIIQPTQSKISFPFFPMSSPMQSPVGNYYVDPAANLQIFGFRGYVCDKCLTPETYYVAFPTAKGQGGLQGGHFCDPAKAVTASKSVDRPLLKSLHDRIPMLIKQNVNSRNGNNNHLIALRLSNPQEEIIKLRNPANPSKPAIVFRYSEQRHIGLESAKENKNKCDYLTKAITLGTTPVSDEELIDFLKQMQIATFGIVTVHNNNNHEDDLSQDSLSYFVFLYIN